MPWTCIDFKKWIDSGCPEDEEFDTGRSELDSAETVPALILNNNKLTTLPECVGKLVNLVRLYLDNNNLTILPESFGQLVNLKNLYLSNNNLTTLPESFGKLVNLEVLNISHNNNLTILPECIGKLVNLQQFYMSHNNLTTLPESFGQLVNLTTLYLNNNNFSSLPPLLGNLQRLHDFYYANNPVDHVPANVLRMINRLDTVQGVYADAQSVHNSAIQKSLLDSVIRLLAIPLLFPEEDVMTQILEDQIGRVFGRKECSYGVEPYFSRDASCCLEPAQ